MHIATLLTLIFRLLLRLPYKLNIFFLEKFTSGEDELEINSENNIRDSLTQPGYGGGKHIKVK